MPHPERVFRAVQNSGRLPGRAKTAAGCGSFATPAPGSGERRVSQSMVLAATSDRRDLVGAFVGEETPHHGGLLQLAAPDVRRYRTSLSSSRSTPASSGPSSGAKDSFGVVAEQHFLQRRERLGIDFGHLACLGDLIERPKPAVLAQIVEHGLRRAAASTQTLRRGRPSSTPESRARAFHFPRADR